jgi:cell division protein FtsQ
MKKGKKLFFVGMVVAFIAFIWGLERGTRLLLASHLELNTIEVQGFQRTNQQQIMEAASVPLKTPIFQLDLKEIAQRVEALPWVRSCEVRRVLPDKLSVRVIERQPVALIRMDTLYYVDEDGTPFKEPAPGESLDYPILTGWEDQRRKKDEGKELIGEALQFIRVVQDHPHLSQEGISEINCNEIDAMTIFMARGGTKIHMSRGEMELKVRRLEEVWKRITAKHLPVKYIVYECLDRIVVGLEERG